MALRSRHIGFLAGACVVLIAARANGAEDTERRSVLVPAEARVTARGKVLDNGAFTLWTRGVIGDYIIVPKDGKVTAMVSAAALAVDGVGARAAVALTPVGGAPREIGVLEMASDRFSYNGPCDFREYTVSADVPKGYYTVTLTHRNRDVGVKKWRNLFVKQVRFSGAHIARLSPSAYAFFGDGAHRAGAGVGNPREIVAGSLRVRLDPESATWSVTHVPSGSGAAEVGPVFRLDGLSVDLAAYEASVQQERVEDARFGDATRVTMQFRKPGALDITYVLLFGHAQPEVIARLDFTNRTGRELRVASTGAMAAQTVTVGGSARSWTVIGDGKEYNQPYRIVDAADVDEFGCWWYAALKNRDTKRSLLFGSLQNTKGLGRFVVVPNDASSVKVAAYHDYEGIIMPPDASITGEMVLLQFGRRGTDSLERFGDLIAAVHDIHLRRDFPLDPYEPVKLCLFNGWGGYGASVVSRFPYKNGRDPMKRKHAYLDRDWTKANRQVFYRLGLPQFGYGHPDGWRRTAWLKERPLVRRYGQVDEFAGKGALVEGHADWYIDGCIDFSHPDVIEYERQRIEVAIAAALEKRPGAVVVYNWDFVNKWRTLPGQHDPFMTGAEAYRGAMTLWRDLAAATPGGWCADLYMNLPGINYGLVRTMRVGEDSDRGYYGDNVFTQRCTFTEGLVRQLSGRYFYNGRVFWINPDSYHVYVGGLYSYEQAKVHASFCAVAGNKVALAEPFVEYDEPFPQDRLEIARRVAPALGETARAVDVFEHCPARLWDIPVERELGAWHIVGLFNTDHDRSGKPFTYEVRFEDLELDRHAEYLVYEFWTKTFLGVRRRAFTRTLQAPDCEVYSVVPKRGHPVLISTSRHVRHMAYDILALGWDAATRTLSGTSKVVKADPYQLRVFVPDDFTPVSAEAGGIPVTLQTQDGLLTVDMAPPGSADVRWQIRFE